jgi:muramoyltetrapeptide carboxypeptidase
MINHLRLAGKFEDCKGIVMGYYTNCEPEETTMTLKQIFKDLLPKNKPVLLDYSCGHSMPTMTLPLGRMAKLDADAKTLTIL